MAKLKQTTAKTKTTAKDGNAKTVEIYEVVQPTGQVGTLFVTTVVELTPQIVRTLYEANPDTNNFDDAEQIKLSNLEAGAQVNPNAASIASFYASIVAQVTELEKAAGTESELRTFSPKDVQDMIAAGSNEGGDAAMSPSEIRDSLVSLLLENRLPATAIKGLPTSGYSTPQAVRDALLTLEGAARLSATAIKDLPSEGGNGGAGGAIGRKIFTVGGVSLDVSWQGDIEPLVSGSGGIITVANTATVTVGTISAVIATAASFANFALTRINAKVDAAGQQVFRDRTNVTIFNLQNGRRIELPEADYGIIHARSYGASNEVTDTFTGISTITGGYEITFSR